MMDRSAEIPSRLQEVRDALRTARLPFQIAGVVAFGSSATGKATPVSDLDLLVIARGLPAKRHRRTREIVEIKRALSDFPVDVLLLNHREAQSNFENHNPLFLDVAEDGIILLDEEDFLAKAIAEVRQHIHRRGIERTEQGWRFPVEPGVVTYLSAISNRDFSLGMLKDAERDLRIGQLLGRDGYFDKAVYHFQQATEKAIKAILVALGTYQKTHLVGGNLRKIAGEDLVSNRWRSPLLEAAGISEELEPEVSLSRYPGIIDGALWLPSEEYTAEDAQSAGTKASKALEIAHGFVHEWFGGSATSGSEAI
jgi:HEPN domain-containing protein/predicted nucleotidyltransferase